MPDPGSVTPWWRTLGIVPGARWSVVGADPAWSFELAPDADAQVAASDHADVVVASRPRRAAGHVSELGDTLVRETGLAREHLVDTKVAALDHDWSALKFVWRREHC
jgi:hypothetical protein